MAPKYNYRYWLRCQLEYIFEDIKYIFNAPKDIFLKLFRATSSE